ncbi:MAG: DUF3343 domain-containing protein [Lachnospiraceae bacterium]|jgi:glycerol-3-phosphate O-acyltransferase|nr:DUF3343 domain-containing protein [Lachnospiraceae bacterium]
MRKKELMTVLSFAATTDAMALEAKCREEGMPGRIIPTPSAVSAGCGLSWALPVLYKEDMFSFCETRGLIYQKATDLVI